MKDRGYLLRVVQNASLQKLKNAVNAVHEKTGKNRAAVFLDMVWCAARYGAGYYDYQVFGFASLTGKQRATYVTRLVSKRLNEYLNDPAFDHIFNDKTEFNRVFRDFIGRDFVDLERASDAEALSFLRAHASVFVKPKDKECGVGCARLRVADFESPEALLAHLRESDVCTVEEVLRQHPLVNVLYPEAVNCLRVITLVDDSGVPHCLYAVQKMGYNGRQLDNNGLFAPVDLETGVLLYPAHSGETARGLVYTEHPDTHVQIQGYPLPLVREAVALCLRASRVVPQTRYVGWDVALTATGPAIVEGNNYCAHDFWQLPPHTPDGIGMLPKIRALLPNFRG